MDDMAGNIWQALHADWDTRSASSAAMVVAHAASESHEAVYCFDRIRTVTEPAGAGAGCRGARQEGH